MKVWDDHDYGVNDGGKRVQDKTTRKKMFIENVLYFNGTKDIEEDMDKNRDIDTEHDDSIQVIGDNTEKPDQIHEQLLHAHGESLYHYNDIDDTTRVIFMDTRTHRDDQFIRSVGIYMYAFH